MGLAIILVFVACGAFMLVILGLALRASWRMGNETPGWVRKGLVWKIPIRDTLAPWKDEPWADSLDPPEVRDRRDRDS
jgi:hypothetical protein